MMMHEKSCYVPENKESGFSLVELMIALVIGLLILLGAGQLFVMSKQSYDQMASLATRQQSIRAIFDLVSLDIRTAQGVEDNSGNQNILKLSYDAGSRSNDPYCPGTSLSEVTYTFDSEERALYVAVVCGSTPLPSEELVSEIDDVSFLLSADHYDSEGVFSQEKGLSVEVGVTFPEVAAGEVDSRRQFVFKVARRNNIL